MSRTFKTQYDARDRVYSNHGNKYKKLFHGKVDDNGMISLVEDGIQDTYEFIQSFKDSVDINLLVKRYASGETDVLSKVQGIYADFASFPNNYRDMLDKLIEGEKNFDALPVEIKNKFNNNFNEFVVTSGTSDWLDKLGLRRPDVNPTVPDGNKEDVTAQKGEINNDKK